ncbi:glycosyltransferase family 2 protein [Candidatus Margulisiibacteriota bacterium]
MKLSVVIGTYNQKDSLKLVLGSFEDQTAPKDSFEVVLVDSSSSDGTDKMIADLKHTFDLNYIRQEDLGRPGARNRGIKEAKGEIILLTDADMIAHEKLVEEHIKCHEECGNVAIEGLTYNLKRLENYRSPDNLTPYIQKEPKAKQKLHWMYFLSGNLSLRKETAVKAGLFDPMFTGYGWEDIELGYRVHKLGMPIIYLPSAKNYHYHIVSDEGMLERKYNMGLSAAKFYKKHPNKEVKNFLGMHPAVMAIYVFMKSNKWLLDIIKKRAAKGSYFNNMVLQEYNYREGLTDALKKGKA